MNNFIKQVIEEEFASKAQQKFFYAKANEKGKPKKEKKKWSKWAKEFSDETDYDKIPDKVEKKEVDEIVDSKGNIQRGKKSPHLASKGITQNGTSDEVAKTGTGQMGSYGGSGAQPYRRYWGESDMSKSLGYEKTLGQDADIENAEEYFEKELGMDDSEAEDRLNAMGYDSNLPDDKVRLVENPKKFIEEYIESLMSNKSSVNDIVSKDNKEISPIVKKQIKSLKNTMDSHKLSIEDIINFIKNDE